MDFKLTNDQTLLRSSARRLMTEEWPASELRAMMDPPSAASAATTIWDKMASLGWAALLVDEEHEGLGMGMFDLAVLMEETGKALIPGTLHSSAVLATEALQTLGMPEARKRHLPEMAEGGLRATVGIYEPNSGWNPMRLSVRSDSPVVKRLVPDAATAGLVLVINRISGNRVELARAHDATATDLQSMDVTRPLYEVACDRELLEPIGEGTVGDLQAVIDRATIALAAEMVGSASRVLDMTVEYAKQRKQFGRAIGTFQAVQHRAADMLIGIEKARTAAYYAAATADEEPDRLAEAASTAKAAANDAFVAAAQGAIQLHGGLGFTWEQDLHLYLKRAKACEFTYGDTNWHLDRIAHRLGLS